MSGFEGPILKGMNPFSNNKPRLTASERIRNKRDATIYQAEKQRFQNKRTCGNKNVKYYDNGTIRSMKSYKLQKSLARGNVLCEDCDDKGLLCKGPANKNELASIQMGNNIVSEYWGGGGLLWAQPNPTFSQTQGFPVIQSDVSGVWGPGTIIPGYGPKTDLSNAILPGPPEVSMRFGYIDNFIAIPRNLDGSGVVIDPSNELFPDELCDPFRYLKHTNLSTYVVARMLVPIYRDVPNIIAGVPSTCNDKRYQLLVGAFVRAYGGGSLSPFGGGDIFDGVIDSLCCIDEVTISQYISLSSATILPGKYGLFDVYIKLFNITNYSYLSALLRIKTTGIAGKWDWGPFSTFDMAFQARQQLYSADMQIIESFNIIQGTIPPTHNQTKYNATQQSYMSCLENGTRKINFTKNTVKQNNVIAAYCTPCSSSMIFTITVVGGTTDTSSVPGYTIYTFDTSGNEASLIIDISDNTCGELIGLEYLIVAGGGGGGGTKYDPGFGGFLAGGGGGGGEVLVGTKYISQSQSINILAGNGGLGNQGVDTSSPFGEGQDGSGSYFGSIDVSGGQGALSYTTNINSMGAGNGGASGGNVNVGGYAAIGSGLGPPYQNSVAGGGGGGYLGPGGDAVISTNNDASGGIGGIGVTSDISGTSTDYGVGGGGGALAASNVGGGWGPAYAIGGSSCGNILDPSGGHGAPSSTTNTSSGIGIPFSVDGHNASCYGSGGGGGISMGSPTVNAQGGNGKRGIVIIKVKNAT